MGAFADHKNWRILFTGACQLFGWRSDPATIRNVSSRAFCQCSGRATSVGGGFVGQWGELLCSHRLVLQWRHRRGSELFEPRICHGGVFLHSMSKPDKKSVDKASAKPLSQPAELRQVAALPMRREEGGLQVCMVTTRETKRWTIPKGWPMKDTKDCRSAAIEAEQEAGLIGKAERDPMGDFLYWKRYELHVERIRVFVYRFNVTGHLAVWREMGEREVRWFTPRDASLLVEEPGLSALLAALDESSISVAKTA
jgi:NUDIX domain